MEQKQYNQVAQSHDSHTSMADERVLAPVRHQRLRTKGYRKPEGTVYVGRGTKWGNPFKLVGDMIYINARYRRWTLDPWIYHSMGNIQDVVTLYRSLIDRTMIPNTRDEAHWKNHFSHLDPKELKGKDLACWCALDKPCHADVLLKASNGC